MAPGYGHSVAGINMANYRLLADKKTSQQLGYRSTYDWNKESTEQIGVGNAENNMSSTLRVATQVVQEKAQQQVDSDISTVDAALRSKLKHTEQLKNTLHQAVVDTMNEISNCQQLKASMEHRLQKVSGKSELNGSRLDVRTGRPAREKTMDEVEVVLLQQKSLMAGFEDRVQRAISNLDREVQQLDACRRNLEADLQDKIQAIDVDSRVLGVQQDGSSANEVFLRNMGAVQMKSPHSWVTSTDANVREARKWIADSARLRKAIRVSVHAAREQEHSMSRTLNNEIMSKISTTRGVKNDIEMQLKKVREEQSKVEHQRKSLAKALEAKRGPLAQAKERFNTRRAMPDRELVQDEVEAALAQEIAHLNSVTLQLANKLSAVDKTMATLDMTALSLEENLKDKETTLCLDEHMTLLDGRINVHQPPPTSIASMSTASMSSEVREATMRRIQGLESELEAARKERIMLESNVSMLRTGKFPRGL